MHLKESNIKSSIFICYKLFLAISFIINISNSYSQDLEIEFFNDKVIWDVSPYGFSKDVLLTTYTNEERERERKKEIIKIIENEVKKYPKGFLKSKLIMGKIIIVNGIYFTKEDNIHYEAGGT
jgi:hypothetical protein